jgi:hypothetical protein
MPSALETLMKILRLEREQGYKNTAVIGGLGAFATNWQVDAHAQARKPEHHELVDELVGLMQEYDTSGDRQSRHLKVKYMTGRITGRVQPGESVKGKSSRGRGVRKPSPERAAPQDRRQARSKDRPPQAPERQEQAPSRDQKDARLCRAA